MKESITSYQKKLRLSNNLIDIYETTPYENKDQFIHDLLEKLYNERQAGIMARNMKQQTSRSKRPWKPMIGVMYRYLKSYLLIR